MSRGREASGCRTALVAHICVSEIAANSLSEVWRRSDFGGRKRSNFLQVLLEEAIFAVEAHVAAHGPPARGFHVALNVATDTEGRLSPPKRTAKLEEHRERMAGLALV